MIKIKNEIISGWSMAIKGMRNPMNSWDRSDSSWFYEEDRERIHIGPLDYFLMMKLAKAGSEHAKYRRMISVWVDITAPLYFWKEFDTYKVGTVSNSCSTMHKIAEKEFTLEDFSSEHLFKQSDEEMTPEYYETEGYMFSPKSCLEILINVLNACREKYLRTKEKKWWWQMIQLLPSSYNQRRTIMLNYEVLAGIYRQRQGHKLDEWRDFCQWIKTLPYSELITVGG